MSKKILLLGGSGRVGRQLKKTLANSFEIVSPSSEELDIKSTQSMREFIPGGQFEVIINSVMAPVSVDDAQLPKNNDLVFEINSKAAGELAKIASEVDAHYIYLSTAYVFDGKLEFEKSYLEEDNKNPLSVYGKSKSEGEDLSLENNPKTTIIRIEMPYSDLIDGPGDILKTFYKMLSNGQTINALEDQFCTPSFIPDIAEGVQNLIDSQSFGIYHVAGTKTTPFEVALTLAKSAGFDLNLVQKIKFVDYKRPAPRPQNSSLDNKKYSQKFSHHLHNIEEGITKYLNNLNNAK